MGTGYGCIPGCIQVIQVHIFKTAANARQTVFPLPKK
jgi:hypothetical protein